MSDFINKAKPENDFNNGGSTLGTPGGGTAGPQTQLSNQNQEGVEASLEATADTAKTSQSGPPIPLAAKAQMQAQPNCPADYPANQDGCCGAQFRAPLTLDMIPFTLLRHPQFVKDNKALIREEFNEWRAGLGMGLPNPTTLVLWFLMNGLPMGDCGCWTQLIGLSDLFGGAVGLKLVRRVLAYFRGYKAIDAVIRQEVIKKIRISYPKFNNTTIPEDVYEQAEKIWKETGNGRVAINVYLDKLPNGKWNPNGRKQFMIFNFEHPVRDLCSKLLGVGFQALFQMAIYRPIQCFGNATLNPFSCECECPEEADECGVAKYDLSSSLYDVVVPNFFPSANELKACKACECKLEAGANCFCTNCEDGYVWKAGSYCDCRREIPEVGDENDAPISTIYERGMCVNEDVAAAYESVGQIWDAEDQKNWAYCSYACPWGSDRRVEARDDNGNIITRRPGLDTRWGPSNNWYLKTRSCGRYARYNDNLCDENNNDPDCAPTKGYYTYVQGCNCICDGRDQLADGTLDKFPPDCPEGYVWNGSPYVCNCVPCPVKLYYCTDSGSANSSDDCPGGYEFFPGDSPGCGKTVYIAASVDGSGQPTNHVHSVEACISQLGMGFMGGWYAGEECSTSSCFDENGPTTGCI